MTDDVAGQYSDYQDREEASSKTIDETIADIISKYLSHLVEEHTGISFSNPDEFRFESLDLIKQLSDNGFEISLRKEVSL